MVVSITKWLPNTPSIHEARGVILSTTKEYRKPNIVNRRDAVAVVMFVVPCKTTQEGETGNCRFQPNLDYITGSCPPNDQVSKYSSERKMKVSAWFPITVPFLQCSIWILCDHLPMGSWPGKCLLWLNLFFLLSFQLQVSSLLLCRPLYLSG